MPRSWLYSYHCHWNLTVFFGVLRGKGGPEKA
jgi:hypothetical protein